MTHDAKENVPRTLITAGVKGHAEQGIGSVRASRKGMKHGLCPWAAGSRHQLLYGTTGYGGDTTGSNCLANIPGCGVVFELTQGTWEENVLYTFTGGSDGSFSSAPLTSDSSRDL